MPILQYETRVSSDGTIAIPPIPEYRDRKVVVSVDAERTPSALTNEEKRQQRIAAEKARIMDRTPEEREAAFNDFMTAWKGCLKGVPHMTAKEIRAERLEKKYGDKNESSTD